MIPPPLNSEMEWLRLDAERIRLLESLAAVTKQLEVFNPFAPGYEPLTRARFDNLMSRLAKSQADPFAVWLSAELLNPDSGIYSPSLLTALRTVWEASQRNK